MKSKWATIVGVSTVVAFSFALPCLTSCQHGRIDQLNATVADQSTKNESLEKKIERFEKELLRFRKHMKAQSSSMRENKADTRVLVQDLRIEIQRLRGHLEEQNYHIEQLRIDLGKSGKGAAGLSTPGTDDVVTYDRTLKLVLEKKAYTDAIVGFKAFVKKYKKSPLVDNAHFWMAESYYQMGKHKEAIANYQIVVEKYPKSEKRCTSHFKIGRSFEALKQRDNALLFYEETVSACAKTNEANLAKKRLAVLK